MDNAEFLELLEALDACGRSRDYIRDSGLSLAEGWAQHAIGPDMAWLLAHLVDRRRLALILADVLEPAIASQPEDQRRGAEVDTLRRWGRGEASDDELDKALENHFDVDATWFAYDAASHEWDDGSAARAYDAIYHAKGSRVGAPAIIQRHVSPEEVVQLARMYIEKNQ